MTVFPISVEFIRLQLVQYTFCKGILILVPARAPCSRSQQPPFVPPSCSTHQTTLPHTCAGIPTLLTFHRATPRSISLPPSHYYLLLKMGGFSISIFMYFDVFRRISDVFLLVPVLSYFHVSLCISSYSDVFLKIHINTLRYTQIHCISTGVLQIRRNECVE